MANIIGPARLKALETRRSPYIPRHLMCLKCSDVSKKRLIRVQPCRVYQDGLLRPGVQCPKCLTAWMEAEDHPTKGYAAGECSVINIEPQDFEDDIAAEATLYHEAIHARDIAEGGLDNVSKEHEIRAHEETSAYLRRRLARERNGGRRRKIERQIVEEKRSISVLRRREG